MFSHRLNETADLRLLEERHAEALHELGEHNVEHLRAWLPWVDSSRTLKDRKEFIRGALKQFAENNGFQAGVWYEGRLAGVVGHHAIDWQNRSTTLGYWLGKEFQGRGLMTLACGALVDHAFGELGLNRVSVACATQNTKSCAIPERLGFRREGIQRQAEWLYDHFVDHVIYAALAHDWQKRS